MIKNILMAIVICGLSTITSITYANNSTEIAASLRHNVVAIKANWENGQTHNGFGWIVGVENNKVYIVTANHVVRGRSSTAIDRSPSITIFFEKEIIKQEVKLLTQNALELDLAVLEMPLPDNLLVKLAIADLTFSSSKDTLSYIGAGNDWVIPKKANGVLGESDDQRMLLVDGLDVDVGTSGAPLVGDKGVLGMFVSNATTSIKGKVQNHAKILSINTIREKFKEWQYPWSLKAYSPSPIISGDWHYLFPGDKPIKATIYSFKETPHHFKFTAQLDSGDQVAAGIAVIDGESFSAVYESVLVPSIVKADLLVKVTQTQNRKTETLLLEGIVSFTDEHDGHSTEFMRLVKLNEEGKYFPKAITYLKNNRNPELDEVLEGQAIADEIIARHKNKTLLKETSKNIPTPPVKMNTSQYIGNPRIAEMMVPQIQQVINMLGIGSVKLEIKNNCIVATGEVDDADMVEQISGFLQTVAAQSGMNACNEVTLTN